MMTKLHVYVAGSFKQRDLCVEAGRLIRDIGVLAYVFCDEGSEAFPHSMKLREENLIETFTPMTAIEHETVKKIYAINMTELEKSDVVLLMLPCGKSAHMEAGWIKGVDGKVIIYGEMIKGEFDAMYGMADLVTDDFNKVLDYLCVYSALKGTGQL